MPITPPATTPVAERVSTSQRLWSDEVGIASGKDTPLPARDTKYEWSNGRKFEDGLGPYIP